MLVIPVVLRALSVDHDDLHVIAVAVAGRADRVAPGDKWPRLGSTATFEA
jgi:hypothetical protein